MGKNTLQFTVPASLSDITLEQYQKYAKVVNSVDKEGEEAADFINRKALHIFCGLELKDSYNIPMYKFDAVIEKLYECLQEDTPLVKRFWLRGSNGVEVEFGLHPDLHNMTSGEYWDLDKYINDFDTMHKAMAVLFRPIVEHAKHYYEIEEYEGSAKYAEYMKYMPANVALGARLFFYRLGMKLSKAMMASSLSQLETHQLLLAEKRFLEENGVGINQFMHSLEETFSNLTKLPNSVSTKV